MKANLNRFVNAFTSFVSNHFPFVFRTMSPTRAPSTRPLLEKRCAKYDMGTQHWPEPGRQEPQCWHRPSRSSCTWPSSTIPPRVWLLTTCKLLTCGPNLGIFPLWKVQKIKSHFYSGRSAQKKIEENKSGLEFNFLLKSKCASLDFDFWVLTEPY